MNIYLAFSLAISLRIAVAVLTSLYDLKSAWCFFYFVVGVAFVYTARKYPPSSWWEYAYTFHGALWGVVGICVAVGTSWCATAFIILDTVVCAILWGFDTDTEIEDPLLGV